MSEEKPAAQPSRGEPAKGEPAKGVAGVDTVEQLVRTQLAKALGGKRGVVESALPMATFTITYVSTHELKIAIGASVGLAVVMLVLRIAQKQPTQFVLNSFFGILIAATFASRSGKAEDAFLPGILYNAAYSVGMITSILLRAPLVGFLVGALVGDPTGWRKDPALVRLCARLTWLLVLPCIVRVLVQYPLYKAGEVGWLGTSKIALGWPLQVASFLAMGAVLARGRTPVGSLPGK